VFDRRRISPGGCTHAKPLRSPKQHECLGIQNARNREHRREAKMVLCFANNPSAYKILPCSALPLNLCSSEASYLAETGALNNVTAPSSSGSLTST
jgi:hypothetical protein